MFTSSTGATLTLTSCGPVRHASGGCRRHRTSPTIPSEPPSLAHPTRRAAAAEKGGPSLWWARVSDVLLPTWARGVFRPISFGLSAGARQARDRIPTRPHLTGEQWPRDRIREPALHIV